MDRRTFLTRGTGAALGLASTGLCWRGLAQDRDGSQARGMINERTLQIIDAGLAYLGANQFADGSFGTQQYHGNVAVTALGGLAFMAGGNQPGRGRYGNHVTKAVDYILSCEDQFQNRGFLTNPRAAFHGPMYGHGFATLFLAEVYGMVNDANLRNRVRGTLHRAIDLIINSQNQEGGWRYRPVRHDADLSVTICQIMALRAARNAGVAVPKKVADDCIKYVKACQDLRGSGGFKYQQHGGQAGFARTAAGVVALYSAGVYEGEAVDKGLQYLKRFQPGANQVGGLFANAEVQMHYYYGHYYAVQAMWIAGGDYWRAWYPAIRDELLQSYRPNGQTGHWQMGIMCPHYCTAMALIILQVPNNYLPILQR
jgi:prenyltransferase beta subunit